MLRRVLRQDGVPRAQWPLHRRLSFGYDARRYGFEPALVDALGAPLSALSAAAAALPRPPPALQHALVCAGARLSKEARKSGSEAWYKSEARAAFMRAYLAFVRDEVLPRFDDGSGKIVYQAEPSVRVCLPSARAAGGKARCDADHFHQPGEISP